MTNITRHPSAEPLDDDEISPVEIVNTLLRNWRIVLIFPIVFVLATAAWSLTRDRTYAASASFSPQAAEGPGAAGGAAALAQQFGLNLGGTQARASPQFFAYLLRSRALLRQAVEAEYELPADDGGIWRGSLVEYWDLHAAGGPLPPWLRATELLQGRLATNVTRETGVVQLTVTADHPILAEQIAGRLLELLNQFNLQARQRLAQQESEFIEGRLEEARAELNEAERAIQAFLQQNREYRNSPALILQHDRLERQIAMRQELYTSLLRSQEQARIDVVRDIPLLTVIEHPEGAAKPRGRQTVERVLLAGVLGLLLGIFVAFVVQMGRRSRDARDPHYQEFQGLAREAWHDLRHPGRWVRRRQASR